MALSDADKNRVRELARDGARTENREKAGSTDPADLRVSPPASIYEDQFRDDQVSHRAIRAFAVGTTQLGDLGVTNAKILGLDGAKLQDASVGGVKLADGAVGNTKISGLDGVTLQDESVGGVKLRASSVGSREAKTAELATRDWVQTNFQAK